MTLRPPTANRQSVPTERHASSTDQAFRLALPRRAITVGWRWLLGVGLFLLALLPRTLWLGQQSLWLDEGSTWQTIQQSWGQLINEMTSPVSAYPLYHLLLKGWVAMFGDSEWALRLPSALAGAGAVVALCFAALELQRGYSAAPPRRAYPVVATLLLLTSPFALWYAQEAKAYSLLLLFSTLLLWSLLRAFRTGTRQAWLVFGIIALTSVFVHRLAVLLLIGAFAAGIPRLRRRSTRGVALVALGALSLGVVVAMIRGLGDDISETGAYIPASPLHALGLTFVRFSVDRWPNDVPWWWLLPWVGLALYSVGFWILDFGFWMKSASSRNQKPPSSSAKYPTTPIVLFCFITIPLVLFLTQLAFTRLYEARYLLLIYPAWVLLLAYPMLAARRPLTIARRPLTAGYLLLLVLALVVNAAVLVQPKLGMFSGDPVKEQYRATIDELTQRVHPDDLVILHPSYLRPLYNYYTQRLTTDPPPEPITFAAFKRGQTEFNQKDWDTQRRQQFAGYMRSFLLIAPEHARTVDVPPDGDEYGLVGLYFQYSSEQNKWPCGIWRFNGAHLLCQDSPETYETGQVFQPATELEVSFGEHLELRGYTLKATTPAGPGVYRAGGTLPITLFWDVAAPLDENLGMFLHLCRDCDVPPAASTDGQPLEAYLPTSVWLPGKPVHDERAIPLPRDLPPGRYTLLLGVYPPGDPAPEARLAVQGDTVLANERLVLGTVEVVAPEQTRR